MIKTTALRYAAIGMASLSLAGMAAASTVTVGTTGADSYNKVELENNASLKSYNHNLVGLSNFNVQGAESGNVSASKNTEAGDATSGDAMNDNATATDVTVSNTGSSAALAALAGFGAGANSHNVTIDKTGADSTNKVEIENNHEVKLSNTNVVEVNNVNMQGASTGNVSAYKNTTVGGLTSGDASNSNTTTTSVHVQN